MKNRIILRFEFRRAFRAWILREPKKLFHIKMHDFAFFNFYECYQQFNIGSYFFDNYCSFILPKYSFSYSDFMKCKILEKV